MIHDSLSEIAKLASATSIIKKHDKPIGITSSEMIKSMDAPKIGKLLQKSSIKLHLDKVLIHHQSSYPNHWISPSPLINLQGILTKMLVLEKLI